MLMKTGLVNASIGCIMSTVEEGESLVTGTSYISPLIEARRRKMNTRILRLNKIS